MAKFTIEWSEQKTTSTGKQKMDALLTNQETKEKTDKVTIWGDYPNFATLMTGHDVEGELVPAKDPKYGPTLYPPKPAQTTQQGAYRGSGGMNKMMETKAKNIEEAQKRKSESIAYFNSVNSAISLLAQAKTMMSSGLDEDSAKKFIIQWRDWFISEYEKWDSQPF